MQLPARPEHADAVPAWLTLIANRTQLQIARSVAVPWCGMRDRDPRGTAHDRSREPTDRPEFHRGLARLAGRRQLIGGLLAQGGQDAAALAPVRMFPLQRLVAMSGVHDTGDRRRSRAPGERRHRAGRTRAARGDDGTMGRADRPGPLRGKTVIVTGAGSGIGRATASRVAREGGRVIAVDISRSASTSSSPNLRTPTSSPSSADITDDAASRRHRRRRRRPIDGLANIAGIMDDMTPVHEVSDACGSGSSRSTSTAR